MKWFGIILVLAGIIVMLWFTFLTENQEARPISALLSTANERYQIIGGISLTLGLILIVSSTGTRQEE